jgi:hypothetical protein
MSAGPTRPPEKWTPAAVTPEHEERLAQWAERGGHSFGPPPPPPCPYCYSYDYGCPVGGCRAPRTRYSEEERAEFVSDYAEETLVALSDLPDEALVDVRDIVPFPERVPLDLDTTMTMGELRERLRNLRSAAPEADE